MLSAFELAIKQLIFTNVKQRNYEMSIKEI